MPIIRKNRNRVFPMDALTPEQRKQGALKARERMDVDDSMGEDPLEWRAARREAARILRAVAHDRGKIVYSDLTNRVAAAGHLRFDPHGTPFATLLGQINILEMERGDPMITAVVVLKIGSSAPGVGFWNLADAAGLFPADASEVEQDRFWTAEFSACHEVWARRSPAMFSV